MYQLSVIYYSVKMCLKYVYSIKITLRILRIREEKVKEIIYKLSCIILRYYSQLAWLQPYIPLLLRHAFALNSRSGSKFS